MALLSAQYRYCRVLVLCRWLCKDVVSAPVPRHDTQSHSDQHCSLSLCSSINCCLSHGHWLVGWDLSNKASGWTGCHHYPGGWSALEPCGLRTEPLLGLKPEGSAKKKKKNFEMRIVGPNDGICAHQNRQKHSLTAMVCPPGSERWMWTQVRGFFSLPKGREAQRSFVRCPAGSYIITISSAPPSHWLIAATRCFSSRYLDVHAWSPIVNLDQFRSLLSEFLSFVWKMDACDFSNVLCQQYVCKNNAK